MLTENWKKKIILTNESYANLGRQYIEKIIKNTNKLGVPYMVISKINQV